MIQGLSEALGQSPWETQTAAVVAISLGLGGLASGILSAAWYLRDGVFVGSARARRQSVVLPRFGPLAMALKGFSGTAGVQTSLSPDAAMDYLQDRLGALVEGRLAIVRLLTYAPLLVGLFGTMVGLSRLVPYLQWQGREGRSPAIVDGRQPSKPGAPDDPGTQLQGVFVGTLGGIVGSLLASLGALLLGLSADWATRRSEAYIHTFILPQIPEQRVSLRLEEAVLATIDKKVGLVVAALVRSLEPVARNLVTSAIEATEAAKAAGEAFRLTTRAVQEAGNLEAAAKYLGKGIKSINDATVQMEHAATAAREAAGAQTLAEKAITTAATDLKEATKTTNQSIGLLAEHANKVESNVAALAREIGGVSTSFDGVAREVQQRNKLEQEEIQRARVKTGEFTSIVIVVREQMSLLNQEIIGLREEIEEFGKKSVEAIGAGSAKKVEQLATRLEEVLDKVGQPVSAAVAQLRAAEGELIRSMDDAKVRVPEMAAPISNLSIQIKQYMDQTAELLEKTTQLRRELSATPASGSTTEVPAAVEILRSIRGDLGELRKQMAARKPSLFGRLFRR